MNSLKQNYLKNIKLGPEFSGNLSALGEYKGRQALFSHQLSDALESLKGLATVESVESSNRLEGIIVKRPQIEKIVLKSTEPKNRSEQEVAGYRDALAYIHESWQEMALTTELIRKLHSMVYGYLSEEGGNWKVEDNFIIEGYSNGARRIRFRPTPAKETPEAMEGLIILHEEAIMDGADPLIVIPLFVLDFLCIHPFKDGNGRVARLLTLLLLCKAGYNVGRYISLERIFEETRKSYYNTLGKSSRGWHDSKHDIMPWMTYFWGVLIRAYKEFEGRVGTITIGRGSKTEQVRLAVGKRVGKFTLSDIERDSPGVSKDMVRHVLRQMRDEGLVRVEGTGRGARWVKEAIPNQQP